MHRSIRSKLLIAAGAALVIVGAAGWFVYRNALQAASAADGADGSRQVLAASDRLLADLAEAESQRCGYVRDGREVHRERCDEAMRDAVLRADELRRLTAGDAEQQRGVAEVGQEVARVRRLLEASFGRPDDPNRNPDDLAPAARKADLKEAEAGVRVLLGGVKEAEGERLTRGGETARAAAGGAMMAVDAGNFLTLLVVGVALFLVRRDFLAGERSEAAARDARLRAERRAAEAGAALEAQTRGQEVLREQLGRLEGFGAVGRVTSGVAHDFNNLLTVMMTGCAAALHGLRPDDPFREPLGTALKACEKAVGLSRRLLSLSRQRPPRLEPLDLNAVVSDMGPVLRHLTGAGVGLELDLDPGLRLAAADVVRVERVLLNLVVNARDASAAGGRVRVETRNAGGEVLLAVIDNGCGMDEATKARVFEPFFTTKGDGKGTGLGMAVVLEAVREGGGRVEVDSAPGSGTAVRVYFPALAEPSREAATVLRGSP